MYLIKSLILIARVNVRIKHLSHFNTSLMYQRFKIRSRLHTVKPSNSKLFEKQQKVYYCQKFTIEEVIYVINRLKSSQKKFTIDPLFTIARFDCISVLFKVLMVIRPVGSSQKQGESSYGIIMYLF